MQRLGFLLHAFRRGFPLGWGLVRQLLSILGLLAIVGGLQVAGLPWQISVALGAGLMLFIAFEGAFRLWSEATHELSVSQANEASEPPADSSPDANLASQVLDQLKRGRKIRATAPISSDGTSGPIDVWEQDVTMLLENSGRHDLATRFEARIGSDRARGFISGVWATRARMDRKLRLLSEFAQECDDE